LLILILSLYNVLLYNLRILEISWDGAAHASNGIILYDMIREVIIRDHNFSLSAMYRYILVYNLEWYWLGGTIAYFPLFVPVLFMLSYFIFGISFFSAYLVVIIMGNICIIVTFLLGAELFDRRIGLLAALFLAFSSVFFAFSKTALLDVPSATMFTISIYSLIRIKKRTIKEQTLKKEAFLTGLLIGLTFMTKPTNILVFPTIILYFMLNYAYRLKDRHFQENLRNLVKFLKSNTWIFYGILPAFLLISFQMGIFVFSGTIKQWISHPSRESSNALTTIPEWPFYITGIGLSIPELGGFLFGIVYATTRRTNKDKLLLSWYFSVYVTFLFFHKEARYFLIAFPVIFLLLSRAIIEIYDRFKTYHPTVKIGTVAVIAIIFLFGITGTLQRPYGYYYNSHTPMCETPMEEAALFLIEKQGITIQMTLNPTISPTAMIFYTIKHDREHKTRYYDVLWATKRGRLTIDEFRGVIKHLKISYLLISDPGNDPNFAILDKYVIYVLENPNEFSLVRIFQGEYSIYIYSVKSPFV
jgi:hypothetical protein